MSPRKHHAALGKPQRGLHEPPPWQAAVLRMERTEAGREAGDAAGGDSDGVVDELRSEGHLQFQQLHLLGTPAEAGNGDEAVEVPDPPAGALEVDGVTATEKARHHRLGYAGGEAGGYRRVRSRASRFECLDSGLHCGRMSRCDGRIHCG